VQYIYGNILPRPEYPRPDLERKVWLNLNGIWEFDFDYNDEGEKNKWYINHGFSTQITVPFCYQSKMSGIGIEDRCDIVWYNRRFTIPSDFFGKRTILHFGAVDYSAKVWLDGLYLGNHEGGYLPFSFDISNFVIPGDDQEHIITMRVEDTPSRTQPRGKQSWKDKSFECWYTPITGIWQTVWLEAVGYTYTKRTRITPDIDKRNVLMELYFNRIPSVSLL